MTQTMEISTANILEILLLVFVAVGIFLFFRACWRNIKAGKESQANNF